MSETRNQQAVNWIRKEYEKVTIFSTNKAKYLFRILIFLIRCSLPF